MSRAVLTRCSSGIALVAVLVFVALASAGVLALVDRTAVSVMVEARARRQARLSREAAGALQAAQAMLGEAARELNGLHHPAEGWTSLERPAGADTVVVTVEDASARVSLAMLDEETAGRFFLSLGESAASARAATAAWLAHRESNRPRGRRLADDWEQLWRLPGFAACAGTDDRARAERAARARTTLALENFERCNVNTAGAEALRLLGLEESTVQRLQAEVAQTQERGLRVLAAPPPGTEVAWGRLAVTAQALVIEVEARAPGLDTCRLQGLLGQGNDTPGVSTATAGQSGGEGRRLAAVAEEIRRRRALRQGGGVRRGGVAPPAGRPAGADNYQLIESQEWFIEPGS